MQRRTRTLLAFCSLSLAVAALAGCGTGTDATDKPAPPAAEPNNAAPPAAATAPAASPPTDMMHPKVAVETSLGRFTLTLDAEHARLTVENFLEYVESGDYDGTIFHQVFPGYAVLGGAMTPDLKERPARREIMNEAAGAGKNLRGTIAMARQPDVIDSASRQFFINLADNPALDHKPAAPGQIPPAEQYGYCVFGHVSAGMEVIDRIAQAAVHDAGGIEQTPVEPIVIVSMRQTK
jgi:cyclophilin family peptidyl-prolyl cis-trans isomerase